MLTGMTPILVQLLYCASWKMEQRPKIIPYRKRSKVGRGDGCLIGLLYSQTAHDQSVLDRCAQWETNSGRPPGEDGASLEGHWEWHTW